MPQHLPLQAGNWSPLNDFLAVSLNPDGTVIGGSQSLLGNLVAVIGDSETQKNADAPNGVQADNWFTHLLLSSNGILEYVYNGAVGGQTSTQLLPLLPALIARAPTCVGIMWGYNDTLDGSNLATTTIANTKAAVALCKAAGIPVFFCALPPYGTAALGTPAASTLTQSASGGTLGAATYSYRVAVTNDNPGVTLASTGATVVVSAGTTNSIQIRVPYVAGMTGYKVYGRTGGSELLIATVTKSGGDSVPNLLYTDTGSITPSGALPGADTTAVAYDATKDLKITTINDWFRHYSAVQNIPFLDFYSQIVEPTTGLYKTGYTTDGAHYSAFVARVLGQYAWNQLKGLFRPGKQPTITYSNSEALNLFSNGCFGTGSGSLPTSWASFGGSGGNFTDTRGTKTGFAGNALTAALTAADTRFHTSPTFTTGYSVGDVIEISAEVQTAGAEAGGGIAQFYVQATGTNAIRAKLLLSASDIGPGVWSHQITAQTGDTGYLFGLTVNYGVIQASVGQTTARNLTTGQLLTP